MSSDDCMVCYKEKAKRCKKQNKKPNRFYENSNEEGLQNENTAQKNPKWEQYKLK